MSQTALQDVSAELKTLAATFNGSPTTDFAGFKEIYENAFDTDEETGTPLLQIVPLTSTLSLPDSDTSNSYRTWTFESIIYVLKDEQTSEVVIEEQLKIAADHLIDLYDRNQNNANWNHLKTQVTRWNYEFGRYRVATLELDVIRLEAII